MKKFIFKSAFFILPFMLSYIAYLFWGELNKGDLIRIGNLIDNTSDYLTIFNDDFSRDIYYTQLSEIGRQTKFDIFTIGDSFSQQKSHGYQNYLSKEENVEVLHYDERGNSIQILHNLINGDFFDQIEVKYVLIQSVEREFTNLIINIDTTKKIIYKDLLKDFTPTDYELLTPKLFSSSIIRFPLHNFLYLFDDNAFISEVYKTKLTADLFSAGNKELLFYSKDLTGLRVNNNEERVKALNEELNSLSEKLHNRGIKLIVLPSPDKYDAYFEYIANKSDYPKPLFFEYLYKQKKDYIYIDTKEIINYLLNTKKDVYFYDNTHWSPLVSRQIAKRIKEELETFVK